MLPPEEHDRDGAFAARTTGEQRGEPRGARALDDELRPLQAEHERIADLVVADPNEVVERPPENRHRQLAGPLHGDAVCDRQLGAGLDAHDPDLRPQGAQREGDAGGQAAAADRDHDGADVVELLRAARDRSCPARR